MPRVTRQQKDRPLWAQALIQRRLQIGKRQEDVAADGGADESGKEYLGQSNVADIESGRVHLLNVGLGRAVALARGLNWTLGELQRFTGVDLGIEVAKLGQEATPIHLQQDLAKPDPTADSVAFFDIPPRVKLPAQWRVILADSDEMSTDRDESIRPGDFVFVNTTIHRADREGQVYAITHAGRVHFRRLTTLPSGPAFTADNPQYALNFIPAEQASVLGKPFYIRSDRLLQQNPRLTN